MSESQDITERLEQVVDLLHDEGFSLRDSPCTDVVRARLEILRLRAELAAAKAEPPRPAAIVVHRHRTTGRGFHLHSFEVGEDAVKYSCGLIAERVLPHDVRRIDEVTWHPKSP